MARSASWLDDKATTKPTSASRPTNNQSRRTQPTPQPTPRTPGAVRPTGNTRTPSPAPGAPSPISAKANRPDPRNSKAWQNTRPDKRPTDPRKQREFDMWANIANRAYEGWEKGANRTYTATPVDQIPEGWVPDPSRGMRYGDAPRGTPVNERPVTKANFRAPQDPNSPLVIPEVPGENRPRAGMSTRERYGPGQGYTPMGDPYYRGGIWYMDFYDPGSDSVTPIMLDEMGTPVRTPAPQNGRAPSETTDSSRQGLGSQNAGRAAYAQLETGSKLGVPTMSTQSAPNAQLADPLAVAVEQRNPIQRDVGSNAPNQQMLSPAQAMSRRVGFGNRAYDPYMDVIDRLIAALGTR